jgi:hypothetical protein
LVGFVIKEALDAYELKWAEPEDAKPAPETRPVPETKPAPREPSPKQKPKPGPKGPDLPPLGPIETSERERRPKCEPIHVPHSGGNDPHNKCADKIPNNSFPGWDVFVNGKNFDALQLTMRTLWEVKTDNFDTYPSDLRRIVIADQVPKLQHERALALACGFDFKVGVRSATHKAALLKQDPTLKVVIMDWC